MESHRANSITSGRSPTVILYTHINHHVGTPKQTQSSCLYSIFGLKVPDDGTVTFYREIKLKLGFGVIYCCYYDKIYLQLIDMGGLRLQRAIGTDIQ